MNFTMANDPNDKRTNASAKLLQDAEAQAMRDKTARLRALRMAQEAANPPAAAKAAPSRASARGKKAGAKSVPLSEWLSSQDQQGRRK
jgi:hypothetical protein